MTIPSYHPGECNTIPFMNLPLKFLLLMWAGWVNRAQQNQIYYLKEENRILREQVGNKRLHLTNTQRRRLAEKAKTVGRKALREQEALSHTPGSIKRKAQDRIPS